MHYFPVLNFDIVSFVVAPEYSLKVKYVHSINYLVEAMVVFLRYNLNSNIAKSFKFCSTFVRLKSDARIALTDDSSTIVCWHPETHFPYEKSLPIPEKEVIKSDSILKVQSNKEFLNMLKPQRREVVIEELKNLTFTTKHYWFPKKQQFRRKKKPESDRPYL